MPPWLLKAGAQGAISLLPGRHRLNAAFQRRVTSNAGLASRRLDRKLRHARRHLRHFADARHGTVPQSAFELGTGQYPIVPIALSLCGVERVVTFDIHELTTADRVRELIARLAEYRDSGQLTELLPDVVSEKTSILEEALRRPRSADVVELLRPLGVQSAVAARPSVGSPGRFELVVSSNTLEHVPRGVLSGLLRELAEMLPPGGVMDHFIDMRDHYAGFDPSLSRLNYLRYSDLTWRLFNNPLQHQNRLRLPQYRKTIEDAGLRVVSEERVTGKDGEFDGLRLARQFMGMPREEVLVLYTWITAVRSGKNAGDSVEPRAS